MLSQLSVAMKREWQFEETPSKRMNDVYEAMELNERIQINNL